MLKQTGIPTLDNINNVFPTLERLNKGAVAVVECFEKIPCNPCYTACKFGAIKQFDDINDLPVINHDKCNGCGICLAKCPGLAIMVVDYTFSETEALIKIPYEFLPLPQKGQTVKGLDRSGNYICDVLVVNVLNNKALDKTPIISIAVNKQFIKSIRNIEVVTENE